MAGTSGPLRPKKDRVAGSSPPELTARFGSWVELPPHFGNGKRDRLFSPSITFWLFLSQVLSKAGSCRETLRKFLAWRFCETGKTASPPDTSASKALSPPSASVPRSWPNPPWRQGLTGNSIMPSCITSPGTGSLAAPIAWNPAPENDARKTINSSINQENYSGKFNIEINTGRLKLVPFGTVPVIPAQILV